MQDETLEAAIAYVRNLQLYEKQKPTPPTADQQDRDISRTHEQPHLSPEAQKPQQQAGRTRKGNEDQANGHGLMKKGLWYNIHMKQKRIEAGSGEKMRKPNSAGAPTNAAIKASQKTSKKK